MTVLKHSIRELRQSRGLALRELADLTGLSPAAITRLERGFEEPSSAQTASLKKALGLEPDEHGVELVGAKMAGEGYVTSVAAGGLIRRRREPIDTTKLAVLDLFCGVGGFSSGFEQTGRFEVVAGVDLLGDRLDTFTANHAKANAFGTDIRQFSIAEFDEDNPRPFVIVGGPPCQGFSSLRPFRNIEWADPRNNLAEEFIRVVATLLPEWIVFENVVGLLTHEQGATLRAITDSFQALGYKIDVRVLNAAHFGLPQKRERLIMVGNRRGKSFQWPDPTHRLDARSMAGKTHLLLRPQGKLADTLPPAVTLGEAIGDLPVLKSGERATNYRAAPSTAYETFIRNSSEMLTLHEATLHSPAMLEIIRHAGDNIHALPKGMVTSGFSSCYSRLTSSEPSTTITVNFVHPASNRCIHPDQDRALTPREGARLQGFFDTFVFEGTRSQTIKQIGNAVPPLLGKAIAEAVIASD